MCRNIKPLYNFEPAATSQEIQNASVQFVRKISGYTKPSTINENAWDVAVNEISLSIEKLMQSLSTNAPKRNREREAEKTRERRNQSRSREAMTNPKNAAATSAAKDT